MAIRCRERIPLNFKFLHSRKINSNTKVNKINNNVMWKSNFSEFHMLYYVSVRQNDAMYTYPTPKRVTKVTVTEKWHM